MIMKKILLILFCLPLIGFGQNVNIPDANFKAYLVGVPSINTNGDAEIQISEAAAFNGSIFCNTMNIYDLTGIEAFTALASLSCYSNPLSNLDLSSNTALTKLYCGQSYINSLDVSNNILLVELDCSLNNLSYLDVSNNVLLEKLDCRQNQITSLNVSNNTLLKELWFMENQIPSIDLSNNIDLTYLLASDNQLSVLDLSENINLEILGCATNQLTALDVSAAPYLEELFCYSNLISVLDLRENINLILVDCRFNNLSSLDIRNGNNFNLPHFFCSYNPNLACINVDDVQYSNMNWTKDTIANFSWDCDITSIEEKSQNKTLLKITDVLGKNAKEEKNTPLFYIYDDGTVEKKIVIE